MGTNYTASRALPVNVEAERSILGAMFLNPAAYDQAASLGLKPEDFALDNHRRIYTVIAELSEAGRTIDLITVCSELRARKWMVGDEGDLSSFVDGVLDRPSIKNHVRLVQDKANLRRIIAACNSATIQAEDGSTSSRECLSSLGDALLHIQADATGTHPERVTQFTDTVLSEWVKLAESDRDLIGLTTGLSVLDATTTGIRQDELWLLAGRTGDGKTSLALQFAAANCRQDIPVGIFSLEMGKRDLLQRLWSRCGAIPFQSIRSPRNIPREVRKRIEDTACAVGRWPLFICDDGSLTIQGLQAKARLLIRREKIQLLIVDYVQLVDCPAQNERERLAKISNGLRKLAKDTGVPIVALSQLSRPKDGNANLRPNRFSLKESGSLENDAHVIVLVYRPVNASGQYEGNDELIIAKQRNGPVGIEKVVFVESTLTFGERYTGR